MPDLNFKVIDAAALPYAAAPTLLFRVGIENKIADEQVHSILLRTQIRIEPTRRRYDPGTQERLLEVFGEPQRWGETVRGMVWTHATTVVPQFSGSTIAELPIVCTYDFEVAAAKYFFALEDGDAPLIFLFSGSVFYATEDGSLQIGQISWEKEARFGMPAQVWHDVMNKYFPNSAWLRLGKDLFDRLYLFRAKNAIPTWDETIERLLQSTLTTDGHGYKWNP